MWGTGQRPEDIPKDRKPWGRDHLSKWEVQLVSPPLVEAGLGLDFGVKEEAPAFQL